LEVFHVLVAIQKKVALQEKEQEVRVRSSSINVGNLYYYFIG